MRRREGFAGGLGGLAEAAWAFLVGLDALEDVRLRFWGAFDGISRAERSGGAADGDGEATRDSGKRHQGKISSFYLYTDYCAERCEMAVEKWLRTDHCTTF